MESFVLKLVDSMLNTFKTILMIKNKGLLSSLFNGLATMAYMLILVEPKKALLVALATSIGSYLSFCIVKRYEKDEVWIFDVMPNSNNDGKEFADTIRDNNIPIMTYIGFNELKEKVVCSKIYSHSKEQSKLIEAFIGDEFKYSVNEVKHYIDS